MTGTGWSTPTLSTRPSTDVFENEEIATNLFEKRNVGGASVYGLELGFGFDLPSLVTIELGLGDAACAF